MKYKRDEKLLITRPAHPPMDKFQVYLDRIWKTRWLTNNGPIQQELERRLCDYLGVEFISLFANGTLALITALKSLKLKGEIITTPFTSIETALAIHWNQLQPVFADINSDDFNIDISKIEELITSDTCAILPVHIFGNPCNLDGLNELAKKYKIKLIYDAAHCFGVKQNGVSICNYGDLSVLSFHATKVFNTIEGGAVISHDKKSKDLIDALANSGKLTEYQFADFGLNAKLNEVQSAYGVTLLDYMDQYISQRKIAVERYRDLLGNLKGIQFLSEKENITYNYSYFPVLINSEDFGATRDDLAKYLFDCNIQTKKYFHPLITDYPEFKDFKNGQLTNALRIADTILCLPLFHDITIEEQHAVVNSILELQNEFKG